MFLQRTIRQSVGIEGVGLHSGTKVMLSFRPAPAGTGVHLVRSDLPGRPSVAVRAENITATSRATTLGCKEFSVATVEHCLSALSVLRIDNLIIELNGPEIPVGDGSAGIFWNALKNAEVIEQDQPRKYLFIKRPIYLGKDEEKYAYVVPYDGLRLTCTIDFAHPVIGKQSIEMDVNTTSFEREIAYARTFGFLHEVEALQAQGLGRGGSLENTIVIDDETVMNPGGLRHNDEFVRHKAMDALGDLVTLGYPLMGHLVVYKAGHDLMSKFVKKVLESHDSYDIVEIGARFDDLQISMAR